jgi:hypothetical protein
MKPLEFDLKIIKVVISLRELNCIGQKNIYSELSMSQATYCRKEKGKSAFTGGELKLIASFFKISYSELIELAENCD